MGDYYQNGTVTTLHNFRTRTTENLEKELVRLAEQRPISLVLPSLFSELSGPALPGILSELEKVPYLDEIIIGLDAANRDEYEYAKHYFSRLPQHHRVIWQDGPRMRALHELLVAEEIAPMELGKGRNAWYCFGYFIASGKAEVLGMHDCDIITYNKSMLARLLYPVVVPSFNYKYAKGYYFRADEHKLTGRVCRLLITPLLRSLKKFYPQMPFLEYIDSFRYPLSGEMSMRADVVKTIRIPSDWGLEIGFLSEVYRNVAPNRICQVEVADRYDHKHQEVSEKDPNKGLSKMSIDISKAIFRQLASNSAVFTHEIFRSIKATYYRIALDFVEQYHADAVINGLYHDVHEEEQLVDLFAQNIYNAGEEFLSTPMQKSFIPSWKRVMSAIPNFLKQLYRAVELDHEEEKVMI